MGHFRQRSRLGGNLPENSILKRIGRKQSKSVEMIQSFPLPEKFVRKSRFSDVLRTIIKIKKGMIPWYPDCILRIQKEGFQI